MNHFSIFTNYRSGLLTRINFSLVLLFVLLLPFNNRFITFLILPWTLISISLAGIEKIRFKDIIKSGMFFLIFYAICLLSMLYTRNIVYGIKSLETMVSFIIMPFLLLTLKSTAVSKKMEHICNVYVIGLVLYILVSIIVLFIKWDIKSISNYLETNTYTSAASYFELSFCQHRSYISMYLIWGIVLIVNNLFHEKRTRFFIIKMSLVLLFVFYIILLGSRAALITLLIVSVFYVWKSFNGHSVKISIPVTLAVLILIMSIMMKFTRIGDTVIMKRKDSTSDIRISLWTDAFKVFNNAPLFGHGIGDGLDQMIEKHGESGLAEAVKNRFNAHNQFLETATQTGIPGLISLILILLIPLINALRKKQELLFLLIIIIVVNLIFESMFVRLAGVLFLTFWLNFLVIFQGNSELRINLKQ
jgi:O-antigen ligase